MSLLLRDYDYALPPELIASHPLADRAASRMMVLHRSERRIEHRAFADFPGFLRAGDLAVLNDTKVIPARAWSDDGRIEFLFLESRGENRWVCMVKPGRKMRLGTEAAVGGVRGKVVDIQPGGERVLQFEGPVDLDRVGQLPIPPYMGRAAEAADAERYQTVYAREAGAIAAPTAGLHFTPEILARVPHVFLTLHVGAGTFKPVQAQSITGHAMHSERFDLSAATAGAIHAASRVAAIGTTTVRVLESCAAAAGGDVIPQFGSTSIFIHPPYEFKVVDALLTNFHLPKSTLLMLVSAFAGLDFVREAYQEAIRERYRFYSYGDCMLIL